MIWRSKSKHKKTNKKVLTKGATVVIMLKNRTHSVFCRQTSKVIGVIDRKTRDVMKKQVFSLLVNNNTGSEQVRLVTSASYFAFHLPKYVSSSINWGY